jgi:hypothetical protein
VDEGIRLAREFVQNMKLFLDANNPRNQKVSRKMIRNWHDMLNGFDDTLGADYYRIAVDEVLQDFFQAVREKGKL